MNTIMEALQSNEIDGRKALESMTYLVEYHPALFESNLPNIIKVIAEVMNTAEFDDNTRSIAGEMVTSLTSSYPTIVRKLMEVKTLFFPAIFGMIADIDLKEDSELLEWGQKIESDDISRTDPHAVGK